MGNVRFRCLEGNGMLGYPLGSDAFPLQPSAGIGAHLSPSWGLLWVGGVHERKRTPNLNFFRVRPECN
eukprot:3284446-Amphidinium_carterae.1